MTPADVGAFERSCWDGGLLVAGADEVGRGAGAGPVCVSAVILDPERLPDGIADSKVMTPQRRELVARQVVQSALAVVTAFSDAPCVDRDGLIGALQDAALRAVTLLSPVPDVLICDGAGDLLGVHADGLTFDVENVPKADSLSVSVGAASIVAKTVRDSWMVDVAHVLFPQYGFDRHKGYLSADHLESLRVHGPCAIHRMSVGPVAQPPLF